MIRIALQTAVAAAGTFLIFGAIGRAEHMSWAVIAALFTISVNTDGAVLRGVGQIAGSFLGVLLGLAVAMALPAPVAIGLALATAVANVVATLWPSLRYAAVTAAIVALEPTAGAQAPLEAAGAILVGTTIGIVATVVVWPSLGRQRAAEVLRDALGDCATLLGLIADSVGVEERTGRDAAHGRFLSRLETIHGILAETYVRPRLRNGAALREAAVALEAIWHSIVILDRVVSQRRYIMSLEALRALEPEIRRVHAATHALVGDLMAEIDGRAARAPETKGLVDAVAQARERAEGWADREAATGAHALIFALDELEARALQLVRVLGAAQEAG